MKSKQLDRYLGIRVTEELYTEFSTCVLDLNTLLKSKNLEASITVSDQVRALMKSFVEHHKHSKVKG